MVLDWLGQPIEVGDYAVYASSGRHALRSIVKVTEVRKRVKIRNVRHSSEFWADASSLCVVECFKSYNPQRP